MLGILFNGAVSISSLIIPEHPTNIHQWILPSRPLMTQVPKLLQLAPRFKMFQKRHAPPPTRINPNEHIWHKFSWWITYFYTFRGRHNVLLTVHIRYRYWTVSKLFKPSKVTTKIYILCCAPISFTNKYVPHTIKTPPPEERRRHSHRRERRPTVWEPLT
jgi:hypothetical protein